MRDLHADIADVARMTVQAMHKEGQLFDADELYAAVVRTFQNDHLNDDTKRRLRVFIERWVARVTAG